MTAPGVGTLRRAEEAHYALQGAIFFRRRQEIPGASLVAATAIEDPEWNHAALLRLEAVELGQTLKQVRHHYHALGRPAALVTSPFSKPADVEARLRRQGFAPTFHHVWHFAGRDAVPAVELATDCELRIVDDAKAMQDVVGVFERVYEADLETGAPVELDPGYAEALRASFHGGDGTREVVHYLALVAGRAAGIATSIHGTGGQHRAVSGLYNLAVLPGFRRRGLGAALVRRRALDAFARGQRIVFLQTERESVERRLVRQGFVNGFTSTGWVESTALGEGD